MRRRSTNESERSSLRTAARLLRSRKVALGATISVVVAFALGWVAANQFQSPAQQQANARPPKPVAVLEKVTIGALSDRVSGSGTVSATTTVPVRLASLPPNPVVTAAEVASGDEIRDGSLLTELNGRPVFVLQGAFDFYRDMGLKAKGPDVAQLQHGLVRAGLLGARNIYGTFDKGTQVAVDRMYRANGYAPPHRVHLGEVVVVKTLPATVASRRGIGAHPSIDKPIANLSRGSLVVKVDVASSAIVRIKRDMVAQVTVAGRSDPFRAEVSEILEAKSDDATSEVVLRSESEIPQEFAGKSAVAIITIQSVAGKALLVPTRAVGKSDKAAYVLVARQGGALKKVGVRVLGELAGQAAIKPADAGALVAGDEVKVG